MKYSAFLVLFLFPFLILKAQKSNSFVVEYGVEYRGMALDTSKISDKDVKRFHVYGENKDKRILKSDISYFTLKVNEDFTEFRRIPIMTSDGGDDINDALLFFNDFIYSINENILYEQRSIKKKEYLIKLKKKYKWKITQEQKTILGYTCTKAIHSSIAPNGNENITEAWFTFSIPVSAGPDNYIGLPGLILAVKTWYNRYLYARNIKFKDEIQIKHPDKNIIITKEKARELDGW